MPAVEIAQHWVDELAGLQPEPHTIDLTAVVDTALQQYAYRQRQEKITRERQWYEANHAEIVQQYRGKYIGIHNGQIVDSDIEGPTLSKRLRKQFGRVAIAIILVETTPEPPTLQLNRLRFLYDGPSQQLMLVE